MKLLTKGLLFLTSGVILVATGVLLVLFYQHFKTIGNYPVTSWLEDHKADCAIVLTGGANRLDDAIEQLYLKRVSKLIITGVNPKSELRDFFPKEAFFGDLDPGDIILEKQSLSTYGNAVQTLPLVEALNCKDVVLITSKLHMYRAHKVFRTYFPEEIPIYRRSTVGKRYQAHWSRVAAEAVKTLFYDLWFF